MAPRGKLFAGFAAISLLAATLLGAYASHGMQSAPPAAVDAVRTAVEFQFYHGLALLAVPLLSAHLAPRWTLAAGSLFVVGTLLFCGGIYASYLLGIGSATRIAPLGGISFAVGWASMAIAAFIPASRRAS